MGYASARTTAPRQAYAAPTRSQRTRTPSPAPCGNQAQLRRLQTKLKVGAVNDPLEHEANRVADQVMRMPDPGAALTSAPAQVSRKCAACEEEAKLQKKEAGPQAAVGEAPASVHEALRSPGQPLDAATRAYFEPRFGHDFSSVRVHSGPSAAQSARDVNAHAYTVAHNIAFDSGRFAPDSQEGRRLIAHELSHVVQQGQTSTALQRQPPPGKEASDKPKPVTIEIGEVCVLYEPGEEAKSHTAKGVLDLHVGFEGYFGTAYPEFYGTDNPDAVVISDFEVDSGELRPSTKSELRASWVSTFKPTDTLEFIGYTDCVGPESGNVSLRQNRAKAVADLFPSKTRIVQGAPTGEYLADGSSRAGRALNRSVIIRHPLPPLPTPPKHEATTQTEEPPTKDCSEEQRKQLAVAFPGAKLMAQRALAALSKRDSVVDLLLQRYFGADAQEHLSEIRDGFSQILNDWKQWDTRFDCEIQTSEQCALIRPPGGITFAYVTKKQNQGKNEPYGSVHVCEKAFDQPDDLQSLSHTVLHELSHRLHNTEDQKYCWESVGWCSSLDTNKAVENADSYSGFARDYFNTTL